MVMSADGLHNRPGKCSESVRRAVDRAIQFGIGFDSSLLAQSGLVGRILGVAGHHRNFWRIEQTLDALCSSRFGVELLPPEYDVFLDGALGDRPCRHYVGSMRHRMGSEGMRKLVKENFLQDLR